MVHGAYTMKGRSVLEPQQVTENTLRMPFALAHGMLNFYAEGAKAYWRTWGPIGQPAIQAVSMCEETQRRYLEALEAALVPASSPRTPQAARKGLPVDLFSVFGLLGVDD
jgi:hypothetical protein